MNGERMIVYIFLEEMKRLVEEGKKFVIIIDITDFPDIRCYLDDAMNSGKNRFCKERNELLKNLDVSHRDFSRIDSIVSCVVDLHIPVATIHNIRIK